MRKAGLVLIGIGLSTGLTAAGLLSLNLIVWGVLAAWAGSLTALAGFVCIFLALMPQSGDDEDWPLL